MNRFMPPSPQEYQCWQNSSSSSSMPSSVSKTSSMISRSEAPRGACACRDGDPSSNTTISVATAAATAWSRLLPPLVVAHVLFPPYGKPDSEIPPRLGQTKNEDAILGSENGELRAEMA
mmetsp:Transcript_3417/g.9727  ORF Transcript_3417/g.9727 Transcript_3417/m.9727 type:complete len:119 (-) Transcript_3417:623-979(-)